MAPAGDSGRQPPLLEFEQAGRCYGCAAEPVRVLHEVSLTIRQGEFVAIMGPSGSGKSTLMNLLGCLDRPTSGRYRVRGVDVATLGADAVAELRRTTFGFVFQRYNLVAGMSAQDNVAMPAVYAGVERRRRRARARELLVGLGLGERLDHEPGQLSGGQQQRVSIARALMNGASVILADEPTGALDRRSGREVLETLHELHRRGHTIVLITHDRDVAGHARRIIELADGRVDSDTLATGEESDHEPSLRHRPVGADTVTTDERNAASGSGRTAALVSPASGHALLREALSMALAALSRHRMRTALTMLGIVIGVASVVAMLAIGNGARQEVLDRIQAMGTDLLSIKRGVSGVRGSGSGVVTLVAEDLGPIAAVPGVIAAVPETDRNVVIRVGNKDLQVPAIATGEQFPFVRNWAPASGTFFSSEDLRRAAQVVVLGRSVAVELFADAAAAVGRHVLIGKAPFLVIGTMSAKGVSGSGYDLDYQLWLPYTTANARLSGQRYFTDINVKVADSASMDRVEQTIRALLTERHGKEDFRIRNMADLIETAGDAQNALTWLLAAIGVISLLVGGIGVMNIMLVSVTERTREIGIRIAIGARQRDVLLQFLTEAVLVCLLGGAIGVCTGIAGGLLVSRLLGWTTVFSATPVLLAFGCAFATGVVFGMMPARKAANLDPVEALARE